MDIISLGAATKAAMEEGKTRKQTLEVGVRGSHDSVAKRLEALEGAYSNSVKKANELIVKDAINIMKAHARLNVVAQSKKYQMQNMIFDDLLDLSGIDTTKSSGYSHDNVLGILTALDNCKLETKGEQIDVQPKSLLLDVSESIDISQDVATLQNGTPIGHGAFSLDSYPYANAFDKLLSTEFVGNHATSLGVVGIGMLFKTEREISKITVQQYYDQSIQQHQSSFIVQYSDNGSVWKNAYVATGLKLKSETFSFPKQGAHKYWRLVTNEVSNAMVEIAEIHMFESYSSNSSIGAYSASVDGGVNWVEVTPNKLLLLDLKQQLLKYEIKLKINMPKDTKLLHYALTWT